MREVEVMMLSVIQRMCLGGDIDVLVVKVTPSSVFIPY